MPRPDQPLSRERTLTATEEVNRRFGPTKATVVEIARVLRVGPAPKRLRKLFDTQIAGKRRRATSDSEFSAAYWTLAAETRSVVAAHVDELVALAAMIIRGE